MIRLLLFISVFISMLSCNPIYYSNTVIYSSEELEQDKVVRLDLSNQNLNKLPNDITKFKNIKFLNLSNNPNLDFSSIGVVLIGFKHLEVLKLDSNRLEDLPAWAGQFLGIKHISLSYNQELNLSKAFMYLKHLPSLEKLNLSHNGLTKIPESISGLTHLKNVRLSYNAINDAHSYSNLSKLSKLKFLWLDNNNIEVLPKNIGELSQITELYLGDNTIKTLPKEIVGCKKLRILYLGNNQFDDLPDEILTMKLYMLVLYGNQIKYIPKSYKKLKNPLSILILDKNYLDKKQQKIAKKYFTGFFMLSFKNQQ